MTKKYANLSKPLNIGKITIKNRFIMAPMDTGPAFLGADGEFSENGIDYFVRREDLHSCIPAGSRLTLW